MVGISLRSPVPTHTQMPPGFSSGLDIRI